MKIDYNSSGDRVTYMATAADPHNPTAEEIAELRHNIAKIDALAAIDRRTAAGIAAGYTYAKKTFSASANAQTTALGMITKIQAGADYTGLPLSTIDDLDEHIVADKADALAIVQACVAHVETWKLSGSLLKQAIRAATPQNLHTIKDNR